MLFIEKLCQASWSRQGKTAQPSFSYVYGWLQRYRGIHYVPDKLSYDDSHLCQDSWHIYRSQSPDTFSSILLHVAISFPPYVLFYTFILESS